MNSQREELFHLNALYFYLCLTVVEWSLQNQYAKHKKLYSCQRGVLWGKKFAKSLALCIQAEKCHMSLHVSSLKEFADLIFLEFFSCSIAAHLIKKTKNEDFPHFYRTLMKAGQAWFKNH